MEENFTNQIFILNISLSCILILFFLNDPINPKFQKEDRNLYVLILLTKKSTKIFGLKSRNFAGIQLRYDDK